MSIGPLADATNWRDAELLESANPMPDDEVIDPQQTPLDLGVIK
jgi:hypothetical protein